MPENSHLSPRQAKWFQSVRAGLESATGLTIDQWADIARTCPEQGHRKRLAWMKTHHGLGQNHASIVFNVAFPPASGWSEPEDLAARLWSDPESALVFAAIKKMVTAMPDVIVGQRKSYTAFSRQFQFAAARPRKAGGLVLGIAVEPQTQKNPAKRGRESWSERLKSSVEIVSSDQIDQALRDLLHQAWDHS
jgi:hypothetical protein